MSTQKKIDELTAARKKRQAIRAAAAAKTESKPVATPVTKPKASVKPAVKASVKPAVKAPVKKPEIKADLAEDGAKAADIAEDLGEAVGPGLLVPEELAEQGTDADEVQDDECYTPGLLIPPDLEDVVTAVCDPTAFSADEDTQFTLYPHAPLNATTVQDIVRAGAHWILCANGRPLAEINLKHQEHADKIAAHFVSADYARSIVAGIQTHGLAKTLEAVKAKPYVAVIDRNARLETERARLHASMEENLRQARAALKSKLNSMIGLALTAAANNVADVQNPLKDAFVIAASNYGVPEFQATEMADQIFFTHGPKTIASVIDKADEWANKSDAERATIKDFVESTARRPLSASVRQSAGFSHAAQNPNYNWALATQMQQQAAPISVPVQQPVEYAPVAAVRASAVSAEEVLDPKAAFRRKHGSLS